ncbi:MAG: Gfo/Idh/MocA family oxidoreductase [Bryobacteraceae bacterium]|nr:Gfo/Idh/MocA family oxidoreductase [Bryobacterales bacterium]MEB2360323.1 Gfo/Idh/MocA family oxidoreductase [Bryobacterales bacterium]NUM99534.1 Gfo/Idh/MocA family oxidoreductase [Bryobacteraceae bacterium]
MNRRTFLGAGTALSYSTILGANDRIRAGIVGAGGRGRYLTGEFKEIGAEMAAVCDVYEPNLQAGLKVASTGAKSYRDYQRLLEDKSIDAVIVATPDHWHAQMVIDAVNAGKDVYVEKPMAHKIPEGFEVIDAVRRTKRIVQVGTQRRSFDLFQEGKRIMDSGQLGNVHLVTSYWMNYTDRLSDRKLQGELDWQKWLGTAPRRELDPLRFFNWYYFFDYSGGLLVGQAAHVVDAIQWFMNSTAPLAVTCTGGKVNLPGAEVPETATIAIEYPENYLATFTLGYKAMRYNAFNDQLKQFHGTKARFDVGREWHALYPQSNAVEMKPSVEVKRPGSFGPASRAHIRNFLECIRSRKEPNAPVEAGQATNIVLCLAMDSLRAGKRLKWNAKSRRVES